MDIRRASEAFEPDTLHRFTVDDLFRMVEAGVISEGRNVELIEGVLVKLAAKNIKHERVRVYLADWLAQCLARDFMVASEPGTRFSEVTYLEPDIVIFRRSLPFEELRGETSELVIEITDTTKRHDYRTKARLYARHGVREYWIVDVKDDVTVVHRSPADEAYAEVSTHPFTATLTPLFAPELAVNLADITS